MISTADQREMDSLLRDKKQRQKTVLTDARDEWQGRVVEVGEVLQE